MKFSQFFAGVALSALCTAASAGVVTVYQNDGPITVATNSSNAFAEQTFAPLSKGILVDFYVKFTGVAGNNDFLGLWLGYDAAGNANDRNIADTHTFGPNIGVKSQLGSGSDLFVRNTGTGATYLTGGAIASGTIYHILGHLYKTNGSATYNQFDAWVNPDSNEILELTGQDARSTLNSGMTTINAFGFRSANLGSGDSIEVTNLRIQQIPEPGSLALAGLALAGLSVWRRRTAK